VSKHLCPNFRQIKTFGGVVAPPAPSPLLQPRQSDECWFVLNETGPDFLTFPFSCADSSVAYAQEMSG